MSVIKRNLCIAAIAWHPINEQMFASGGSDGAVMFWEAGYDLCCLLLADKYLYQTVLWFF